MQGEKIQWNDKERESFKAAIKELIRQADECVKRDKKTKQGFISTEGTTSRLIKEHLAFLKQKDYEFKVGSFGARNRQRGLAEKVWIYFAPKNTLNKENNKDFINSDELNGNKGLWIYLSYYYENKPHLNIGFGADASLNNPLCKATKDTREVQKKYQKRYDKDESQFDKIVDDFIKMCKHFYKFKPEDFRMEKNADTTPNLSSNDSKDSAKSMRENIPLNQILFGPPGTGKTYHTINKALEILGFGGLKNSQGEVILDDEKIKQEVTKLGLKIELKENQDEKRMRAKALFDYFKQKGQIAFVTFHQSYGYEEFVEGIKPRIDDKDSESSEVRYQIKSGIFKRLCEDALKNYTDSQKEPAILQKEHNLDELLEEYARYVKRQLDQDEEPKFETDGWMTKMKIVDVHCLQNEEFKSIKIGANGKAGSTQSLTREVIKRDYENFKNGKIKDWNDVKPSYESKSHRHGNAGYYITLYRAIAEFEKSPYFQQVKSKDIQEKVEQKPYILIIDEINRGNIAKILGELITLLESSKRIGEPEELRVSLPYSDDEFGVPKNLYIIGTMNTADRSIALLDTALRRRFEFIEMMPDSKHLSEDCDGINLKELLDSMNKRITFLLDREHQIGHSFLLDVKNINDLRAVFAKKIIPLLQEYFYDDYAKIVVVLNDNKMVEWEVNELEIAGLENNFKELAGFDFIEKKIKYRITNKDKWQEWQFQKICENNEKPKNTDSTESSPVETDDN